VEVSDWNPVLDLLAAADPWDGGRWRMQHVENGFYDDDHDIYWATFGRWIQRNMGA